MYKIIFYKYLVTLVLILLQISCASHSKYGVQDSSVEKKSHELMKFQNYVHLKTINNLRKD